MGGSYPLGSAQDGCTHLTECPQQPRAGRSEPELLIEEVSLLRLSVAADDLCSWCAFRFTQSLDKNGPGSSSRAKGNNRFATTRNFASRGCGTPAESRQSQSG